MAACLILACAAIAQDAAPGTAENPLLCDGVKGERWYLSRLRTRDGEKLQWKRLGSFGAKADGHILDGYESEAGVVYVDMYHPRMVELRAPKGYRLLTEWSDRFEYVDGKIHAFKDEKPFTGELKEERDTYGLQAAVKDGLILGSVTKTYPDGKVMMKMEYGPANRPHGVESWFKADGTPWATYRYENGLVHGPFELVDDEGKRETGEYVRGRLKE